MKPLLMYPDRDFDVEHEPPTHAADMRQDLALAGVVEAMAAGDEFIAAVANHALLNAPGNDAATIHHRQAAVRDALAHPKPVCALYAAVGGALEDKRKNYWGFSSKQPTSILHGSVTVMQVFTDALQALRDLATGQARAFKSPAFCNFFELLQAEFDDAYLARVRAHLVELRFSHGALISAQLGTGCESVGYTLRRPNAADKHWLKRLLSHVPSTYTIRIAPRDTTGTHTLQYIRDCGIHAVAEALLQSSNQVTGFFETLHAELAFYVGCINLHQQLASHHAATCFPEVLPAGAQPGFRARVLRDAALVLGTDGKVVGNTIDAVEQRLVLVSGANQGGKSTFLRSLGLAQVMLEAGMFVTAEAFAAAPCSGVFTHYPREEDADMRQGKLDEELIRIGEIADAIRPGAWLLCNESFASTNEREGSELARQMVDAMLERGIRVVFVTHLYAFAHEIHTQRRDDVLFLRAERRSDGTRTFQLAQAPPQETSHGPDLYREIFGADPPATSPDTSRVSPAGAEAP